MDITELLAFSTKSNASDLHLSAGLPPMIRVDGDIRRINVPPLEHREVYDMVYDIMNDKQRKDFEEFLETNFSFEVRGRFFVLFLPMSYLWKSWAVQLFLKISVKINAALC